MEVIKNEKEPILDHIDAVAIAPARFIPNGMFNKQSNYVSMDFVPHCQKVVGKIDLEYSVTQLPRVTKAGIWDHDFQSPTYEDILRFAIRKHISVEKN